MYMSKNESCISAVSPHSFFETYSPSVLFQKEFGYCHIINEPCHIINEPCHEINMFLLYVNDKGTDQPAHSRSLISTFVVHYLDSVIPILPI